KQPIEAVSALKQYNLSDYRQRTGQVIETFSQSPMMDERVAQGQLPPVVRRLPDNPVVMETFDKIGNYGGTLRYFDFGIDYDMFLRHLTDVALVEFATEAGVHRESPLSGQLTPGIIESWQVSDDATSYEFRLREGLKWSDGVEVTTEDVRYTIDDVVFNKEITPTPEDWSVWGGKPVQLEIIDKYTFKFTFAKSYGMFMQQMAGWRWGYFIRPKHYLKQFHIRYADPDQLAAIMKQRGYDRDEWGRFYFSIDGKMTDGGRLIIVPNAADYPTVDPWIMVQTPRPGEFIFERNPYFYKVDPAGNQLPYIDRIHRSMVADPEMINLKILSGETDMQCQTIKLSDYPLLAKNKQKGQYEIMLLPAWQDQMLIFPLNLQPRDDVLRPIVSDIRFRQALSMALNRQEINEIVYMGLGREAQFSPPPASPLYNKEHETAFAQFDPAAGNALLDEMNLKWDSYHEYRLRPDGKRLTLRLDYYDVTPTAAQGAELAREYWRDIGVDLLIKQVNGEYFWMLWGAGENQATAWWANGMDPAELAFAGGFLMTGKWQQWYWTKGEKGQVPPPEVQQVYKWRDEMISTPSVLSRQRYASDIFRAHAENLWVIGTVAQTPLPFVYSKRMGNISVAQRRNLYDRAVLDAAEQWYIIEQLSGETH
ncbi:MAG: ABC transporter substrate-binding protein, partial [Gammaproteobacteria bacterium]